MSSLKLYKNPAKSAKIAGLRYVTDQQPGIRRQKWGRGFSYIDVDGSRIKDKKVRSQIAALAIPPSWQDVWICVDENGHLRATGRDLKRRKQYRYHPQWIALRNELKFDRLIPFALRLPTLRQKVQATLEAAVSPMKEGKASRPTRDTVIATAIRLLDDSFLRVGNTQYAKSNQAYGLTTLRDRHANISSAKIELNFIGKSGVEREISLRDQQLAKLIKRCKDIPGYTLFQYFDENNQKQKVDSGDINEYLHRVMDADFTAKDFRTWGGTVTATKALYEMAQTEAEPADAHCVQAVKIAAAQLGNRPATCRKYYVHPRVLEVYRSGEMLDAIAQNSPTDPQLLDALDTAEQRALAVLQFKAAKLDKTAD